MVLMSSDKVWVICMIIALALACVVIGCFYKRELKGPREQEGELANPYKHHQQHTTEEDYVRPIPTTPRSMASTEDQSHGDGN